MRTCQGLGLPSSGVSVAATLVGYPSAPARLVRRAATSNRLVARDAHRLRLAADSARVATGGAPHGLVLAGTKSASPLPMLDISLGLPPLLLVRGSVAAVWLYEGLWCKVLGREAHQVDVVLAVPKLGPIIGRRFLWALGLVEVAIALWVLSGVSPGLCALAQTVLLVSLNANGLLWARHIIHDPGGMVVKNASFLVLAWVGAALGGRGS